MGITARSLRNYQVEITAGNHQLVSDEPVGIGDDAGPNPFDLMLAGLASCTIITLQMYARRKKWPLEGVEMGLDMTSTERRGPGGARERSSVIEMELTFQGPLSEAQIRRLEEIATRCPVHRTLSGDIQIHHFVSNLSQPPAP
jgi:putative redox protein